MNMFLTTNWNAVWSMTGIGIGIVFVILLLLVLVLTIFSVLAKKRSPEQAPAVKAEAEAVEAPRNADEEEIAAAIAASLYLFSEEAHDVESGIITIVHNDRSTWHHFR